MKNYPGYCIIVNPVIFWRVNLVIVTQMWTCHQVVNKEKIRVIYYTIHFIDNETYNDTTCSSKRLYELKPILVHVNYMFGCVYTPEYDMSVDEFLVMWNERLSLKVYIPSKVLSGTLHVYCI
jgi:hypothetical protein